MEFILYGKTYQTVVYPAIEAPPKQGMGVILIGPDQ